MASAITEPPVNAPPLFSHVSFHIVKSERLDAQLAKELTEILKENGATEHYPPSIDGKVPLNGLTHLISETIDFEGYDSATTHMIPVVNKGWIQTSVLKGRLANSKSHSPDPRLFFSGLIVCTADLPEGDKDAIIGGVLALGGLYSGAISKMVTHIVALSMDPQACRVAVSKNLPCKIVLPHWFDDCIRLGKRIDEGPYLLPSPELLNKTPNDHITMPISMEIQGAISTDSTLPSSLAGLPAPSRDDLTVFKGKRILLSDDLNIAEHLRGTIVHIIESGQGIITHEVTDANIVICQYRDGHDYYTAATSGKTVGNLPWLYHLIVHNTWTSPLKRLLHYPIARHGLPGVKDFKVCLSNYNGEARIYLENLAKAAGCEFTKTMKMDNTHLITAHTVSEKCDAAREWNIHIINHLWLEESYARWEVQSLSNPRYTHFPPRTNLTEVVGQTPIDKDALDRHFLKKVPAGVIRGTAGRGQLPMKGSENLSNGNGVKAEPLTVRTPARTRLPAEGKENETPSTTGSRRAKEKAVAQLHELAPDIALYEKEKKRVGGVIFGGRRVSDDKVAYGSRKRSASAEDGDDSAESMSMDEQPQAKKAKKTKEPPSLRLLVTGHQAWAEDDKVYEKEREHLRRLGILLIQDYGRCKYLVAPKILRTRKFVCAIAQAPTLVSTSFLDDCMKMNKLLDPEDYPLKDPLGESRYNLKLPEVIERAKINKGNMLRGQSIWVTENIFGGFETYKAIIEANGGKCQLFRGRTGPIGTSVTERQQSEEEYDDGEDHEPEYAYLVSGNTPQEAKFWPRFCQSARETGKEPRVVRTDWMLDLALSQQIRWDEAYELKQADVKDED